MKKRSIMLLVGAVTASMLLSGCSGSKGLETDELKISVYKGVEIEEVEKPGEVTDEDVEYYIQSARQKEATKEEVTDRPVEAGDTATIDFTGRIDGLEFEGGSSEDYPLVIGSGQFIEGFEDSVIGHNAGETYDWQGVFPENYKNADYAGKDVVFTISVKSISKEVVPELDDDFVKSVSKKSKNVKEYEEEVRKQIAKDNEMIYEDRIAQAAWEKVLENTEVKEYPEDEVKKIKDPLVEQYKTQAKDYEMDYEEFVQAQMGCSAEELEKQIEDASRDSVKQVMVTEAIADKEKIKMTDKVYEEKLEEIAKQSGYDVETWKSAVDEKELKEMVLNVMVKEWLVDHCVQVAAE